MLSSTFLTKTVIDWTILFLWKLPSMQQLLSILILLNVYFWLSLNWIRLWFCLVCAWSLTNFTKYFLFQKYVRPCELSKNYPSVGIFCEICRVLDYEYTWITSFSGTKLLFHIFRIFYYKWRVFAKTSQERWRKKLFWENFWILTTITIIWCWKKITLILVPIFPT